MQQELLMTNPPTHRPERGFHWRGTQLLGLAGGAAAAVLLVALGMAPTPEAVTEQVDSAPPHAVEPAPRLAALDASVDWRSVVPDNAEAGASVAAYERPGVTP
jgi:hypothetical protein